MSRAARRRSAWLAAVFFGLVPAAAAQEAAPKPDATVAPPTGGMIGPSAPGLDKLPAPAEFHPGAGPLPLNPYEGANCPEGHFFASADYLLLQPHRRALDFAITDPNRNGLPEGNVESVFWHPDSGVRVVGGYRLGEHGWEVGAYYTYFYSSASRTMTAPAGGTLYATLTHPGFVDAVDFALGQSRLKYQLFDLEVGRHIEAGDNFLLWLSAGGRLAWIDQTLTAGYDGQSAFQAQVSSPLAFEGAGVRVGAEGQWCVARGFGLYAHAHGSLIEGRFRARLRETNNAGAALLTNIAERFDKVVPNIELGLGVTWQWENVAARVGYEMSDWIGLVDSPDFVHDYTNKLSHRVGDLSLDGLAVRVEVSY